MKANPMLSRLINSFLRIFLRRPIREPSLLIDLECHLFSTPLINPIMDDSYSGLSEIVSDTAVDIGITMRTKLAAEELYQRCLQLQYETFYVFTREAYDNLCHEQGSYCPYMSIYVNRQQIEFRDRRGDNLTVRYELTSSLPILQKFEEILTSDFVITFSTYHDALYKRERMRYYRETQGYPDLIYSNKLTDAMKQLNEITLPQLSLDDPTILCYLIEPTTVSFVTDVRMYQLLYVQITISLIEISGKLSIRYEIGDPYANRYSSCHSEKEFETNLDDYLKRGYLYVDDPDIIWGYTEEEMQWRIASFREQTERAKL